MAKNDSNPSLSQNEKVDNEKQPLLSHLLAARKLIVACAIAIVAGFVFAFYFLCAPLMDFIIHPIQSRGIEIIYTAVSEAMVTQMKVSFIAGVLLVSPFLFYQIWLFVRPALYENEIRLFRFLFFIALLLFVGGVVFCYVYVYQLALNFFLVAGENLATPMLSINSYVNFLFSFILPFGIVFELPVALYMTTRMGLTTYDKLAKSRKFVVLGIAVVAAILTPPDIISQVMLAIPMYLLFEMGIQVARFTKPRRENPAQETSPDVQA